MRTPPSCTPFPPTVPPAPTDPHQLPIIQQHDQAFALAQPLYRAQPHLLPGGGLKALPSDAPFSFLLRPRAPVSPPVPAIGTPADEGDNTSLNLLGRFTNLEHFPVENFNGAIPWSERVWVAAPPTLRLDRLTTLSNTIEGMSTLGLLDLSTVIPDLIGLRLQDRGATSVDGVVRRAPPGLRRLVLAHTGPGRDFSPDGPIDAGLPQNHAARRARPSQRLVLPKPPPALASLARQAPLPHFLPRLTRDRQPPSSATSSLGFSASRAFAGSPSPTSSPVSARPSQAKAAHHHRPMASLGPAPLVSGHLAEADLGTRLLARGHPPGGRRRAGPQGRRTVRPL